MDLVESDQYDLVLTEDLGRIVRRMHAHIFCELCVDHDVRLIALNDHVDTAVDGWQDRSIFSAWHHERSNRDTSDRIKRAHRNRFLTGGCLARTIYGYCLKPGGKTEDDLQKDPEAELIYREWFHRLDEGASYAEIADWLNSRGIPTGPYCRQEKWDGRIVGRVTHNPILKGERYRNRRKSKRNNATGKYKSEKAAPSELLTRPVPHLAFFEKVYYERVVAEADARNAKFRRAKDDADDPRRKVPKKRTRFPGQTVYCGICGRLYVFGGHGQRDHLMCDGVRKSQCWNSITLDGPLAVRKISQAVFAEIEALEEFDSVFLETIHEEARASDVARTERLREVTIAQQRCDRQRENVLNFIRDGVDSRMVREDVHRIDRERAKLECEVNRLEQVPTQALTIPAMENIKRNCREALAELALESFEFAKLMRDVTGRILVYPYRLCEGGRIVLRTKLQLQFANLLPDPRLRDALRHPLERSLLIDLFEPPQPVAFRQRVLQMRAQGMTERQAAKELGLTITAAQHAAALTRLMEKQGLSDPYLRVTEPPAEPGKLRCHLNPRYHFEPLPEHVPDGPV